MVNLVKKRIQTSFNKAYNSYDDNCSLQKKICEKAIDVFMPFSREFNFVADFACGTGVSTKCISDKIKFKKIFAVDFSENLLNVAKSKKIVGDVEYILSDFDNAGFYKGFLDCIFCNMGRQWSLDFAGTLSIFNYYLKDSGFLIFSMPLVGTFCELKKDKRNNFYSEDEIMDFLRENRFDVVGFCSEYYIENFSSEIDALKSIKLIGANCLIRNGGEEKNNSSKKTVESFFVKNDRISLTYNIGIFIAKKQSDAQ